MNATKAHQHKAILSRRETRCFSGCVNPDCPNEAAHGCVTHHDVCRCGATRSVNVNQRHVEYGPWRED